MSTTIKETMTLFPVTVNYNENLAEAYFKMKREGFRHLPVVDEDKNLVGVISDRDFQRAIWPLQTLDAHGLVDGPVFKSDGQVCDYMSWPAKSLPVNTDFLKAIQFMIDEKISSLVITRNEQEIAGIITNEDLLKVLAHMLEEPQSLKEKAKAFAYNSSVGSVFDFLASVGV